MSIERSSEHFLRCPNGHSALIKSRLDWLAGWLKEIKAGKIGVMQISIFTF